MNWIEIFKVALNGLRANKLRAALTILGVVIGVSAVVSMVSIGRAIGVFVNASFADLGATRITISASVSNDLGVTSRRVRPLNTDQLARLSDKALFPSLQQVTGILSVSAQVKGTQPRALTLTISGVDSAYAEVVNWKAQPGGRSIMSSDLAEYSRVALLGTTTVRRLFGSERTNPIGLDITIDDRLFTVVGVLQKRSNGFGFDPNNTILIPLSTAQTRLSDAAIRSGVYRLSEIAVLPASKDAIQESIDRIRTWLRQDRQLASGVADDFTVSDEAATLNSLNQITGLLTTFLSAVGGISLLVGGIGIMNIMTVSVAERTREIGLRKAVGATGADILGQFLFESVMLSLTGGFIGILISGLIILVGNALAPSFNTTIRLQLAPEAILIAVGVSSFVGIFFGSYPASRAARLTPIEALRTE